MTGDDLGQLIRDVRRVLLHLEVGVLIFLVASGVQLGISIAVRSC